MFSALPPLVGVGGGRDHRPHVAPHDGEAALPAAAGLDPVSPEVAEGEEGGPAQDEQEPLLPLHPRLCCVTGSRPHPWVCFHTGIASPSEEHDRGEEREHEALERGESAIN